MSKGDMQPPPYPSEPANYNAPPAQQGFINPPTPHLVPSHSLPMAPKPTHLWVLSPTLLQAHNHIQTTPMLMTT